METKAGHTFADDADVMQYALQIAQAGLGHVEPNPPVGAVVVDEQLRLIAAGFHERFGEPHAEPNAIAAADGNTVGRHLFVTLEPCGHHGKTPPCADAVIAAGFTRIVIGCPDPAAHTSGAGIERLRAAGIEVLVGVCGRQAESLIAPFAKLQQAQQPWVHAKWAMTLDGRIATRTGHSRWISNEESRAEVHQLRGRMDAIITGAGTVRADDPLLTARPPGPRTPLRIVVDSTGAAVTENCQLIQSIDTAPVLVCVRGQKMDQDHCTHLEKRGAEIFATSGDQQEQIRQLLTELGNRQMTHVLLEAGGGLLGSFFDARLIDELHVFVAAKLAGGREALSPVGGRGLDSIPELDSLIDVTATAFGTNVLIEGRVRP